MKMNKEYVKHKLGEIVLKSNLRADFDECIYFLTNKKYKTSEITYLDKKVFNLKHYHI